MGGGSKTEGKVDYGKRKPDEEKRIEMLMSEKDHFQNKQLRSSSNSCGFDGQLLQLSGRPDSS